MKLFIFLLTYLVLFSLNDGLINEKFEYNVGSIKSLIRDSGYTCTDIIEYFLDRSYEYNSELNAVINYNSKAFDEAFKLDEYYARNKTFKGELHCVPIIVKDNIDVSNIPTTGGLKALRNSIPNKNSLVIHRLISKGAVILSKTNLAEMADDIKFYNSEMGGECKNPFDKRRSCGSSSSGSGAGIAAGFGVIGLGTDTDGSLISPSSYCGLFGLRTGQENSVLDGVIPLFERQDSVGPMSKYIDDIVLSYSIMTDQSQIYNDYALNLDPTKLKIGHITNFFDPFTIEIAPGITTSYEVDPMVYNLTTNTLNEFKNLGVNIHKYTFSQEEFDEVFRISGPLFQLRQICSGSCYKNSLNRYFSDSIRFETDSPYRSFEEFASSDLLYSDWKYRLMASNNSESCDPNSCNTYDRLKSQFNQIVQSWFNKDDVDALIMPTYGIKPIFLNEQITSIITNLNVATLSGIPALNVPAAYTEPTKEEPDGLPVGVLLLTKPDRLKNTFKLAKILENSRKLSKLPYSTPLITYNDKCISKSIGFKIKYSIKLIPILLFLVIDLTYKITY